jgi:hypothetical protein
MSETIMGGRGIFSLGKTFEIDRENPLLGKTSLK